MNNSRTYRRLKKNIIDDEHNFDDLNWEDLMKKRWNMNKSTTFEKLKSTQLGKLLEKGSRKIFVDIGLIIL